MTQIKAKINSAESLNEWIGKITAFWKEHKYINATANDKRSLDQNAAIRVCYKQMVDYREDMTTKDVERHCKLTYGVPLLRQASVVFDYVFRKSVDHLSYEQQLKVMDVFKITSDDEFTTPMAKDMIESMMIDNSYMRLDK